jgi:hypothetical protein
VSIDRTRRILGQTWWPEEEITDADEAAAVRDGPVTVMVTHDCPSGVVHSFPSWPASFLADIRRTEDHRDRLQRIVDRVKPSYLLHGHLHRAYERTLDVPWGALRVTGFDCDGAWRGNWGALDLRSMLWLNPESTEGEA